VISLGRSKTERRTTTPPAHHLAARERLIVALDVPSLAAARQLVHILRPRIFWFKIGSILFTAAGPAAIALVHRAGGNVFLDVKFHDIPSTVARACVAARQHQVQMLTLHVQGGQRMLHAAREAIAHPPPLLLGVTQLTSDAEVDDPAVVLSRVRAAQEAQLDGLVVPPAFVARVRALCGQRMRLVTAGIRSADGGRDDHTAPLTPRAALRAGADFLVVGRPIVEARDPQAVVSAVLEEMRDAR